jgi:hypothetical protein
MGDVVWPEDAVPPGGEDLTPEAVVLWEAAMAEIERRSLVMVESQRSWPGWSAA